MVQQPSSRVAHAELPLHRQVRQAGLGLADRVHRQEPARQRQLGVAEECSRGQRGLAAAGVALVQDAASADNDAMRTPFAARAGESFGPACAAHHLRACRFRTKALKKLGHRPSSLELDRVVGHGLRSLVGRIKLTAWVALRVQAWLRFESVNDKLSYLLSRFESSSCSL